jgi:hypothetical protein
MAKYFLSPKKYFYKKVCFLEKKPIFAKQIKTTTMAYTAKTQNITVFQFQIEFAGHGRYKAIVTLEDGTRESEILHTNNRSLIAYLESEHMNDQWLEAREDLTRSVLSDYNSTIEFI